MELNKEDLDFIRNWVNKNKCLNSNANIEDPLNREAYVTISDGKTSYTIPSWLCNCTNNTSNNNSNNNNSGSGSQGDGITVVETLDDLNSLQKSYGMIVYVKSVDKYYSWSSSSEWHSITKIYIGSDTPKDESVLWIDMDDVSTLNSSDDSTIKAIQDAINVLTKNQNNLLKVINYGVVPGDSSVSARSDAMQESDAVKPVVDDEGNITDGNTEEKPDTTDFDHTVVSVNCKIDTSVNFSKNKQNLTDGEICFFTDSHAFKIYYKGGFYGGSTGGGGSSEGGISLDDLYNSNLDYLVFTDGSNTYKTQVLSDGNFVVRPYSRDTTTIGSKDAQWGNYISQYLCINTVYCGGTGDFTSSCSHNFVEIANGSNSDINLNGIFLLYTDMTASTGSGYIWKVLPLTGIIKSYSSYLIRGAQCNTLKQSFIRLDTCDQEWYDEDNLIQFSQTASSFYLAVGDTSSNWVYDENGSLLSKTNLRSPWLSDKTYQGYIDSCGFGATSVAEGGKPLTIDPEDNWNNIMFIRWFMFDPCQQANKAYSSRSTKTLWTYINLETQSEYLGNSIQYYFPDYMKQAFGPRSSYNNKDFFTNKDRFNPDKPNMINITFGIQATSDSSNNIKASRCFNWVSVGYYDEFLQYRKLGDTVWNKVYSITDNNASNSTAVNTFIQHYKRYRWCTSSGTWVTTHKIVLSNVFNKGVYEYRVGRDNNETYYSSIYQFTVNDNSEVISFSYIQDTDQQGFNWMEYQAWKRAAYCIQQSETNYNFTINTGDETQNGNRENEWLDYYDARSEIKNKEEMFTVGNNDLCGHDATKLTDGNDASSKYNHINALRYFTFELDINNIPQFTWNGNTYPIYSLYSYNYGKWHFVSINSETAQASSKTYTGWQDESSAGDPTCAQAANAAIEDWFKKDLQIYKGITDGSDPTDCSHVIVYMHEMPFTIVTWSFMNSSSAERSGSHLNILNANGNYRYSRLLKKYGIRLVMGGHKHTYSISKPIYDAPQGYIKSDNTIDSTVDLMGLVDTPTSRIPVIQVTDKKYIDTTMSSFARYEVVSKINAPTYVMSQASGYKMVSNKEQPSGNQYLIPWLLSYFQAKSNTATPTENVAQHYPMYVRYDLTDTDITITAKQIQGIWNVNIDKNTSEYDLNSQLTTLTPVGMTCNQTSVIDKESYNITNIESYKIEL